VARRVRVSGLSASYVAPLRRLGALRDTFEVSTSGMVTFEPRRVGSDVQEACAVRIGEALRVDIERDLLKISRNSSKYPRPPARQVAVLMPY
jgi:hypothetical protein